MSVTLLPRAEVPSVRRHVPRTRMTGSTGSLVNRLSHPRSPFSATLEGLPFRLVPAGVVLFAPPEIPDAVGLVLACDDGSLLRLRVPAAIPDRLAQAVQADFDRVPSGPTGPFVIELALAPLLEAAERFTGWRVRIENIERTPAPPRGMTLLIEGALADDAFPMQLDLDAPGADGTMPAPLTAVLALVEAMPARTASVSALPLGAVFVAGHVRLSLRHLRELRIGDAILPDIWHPANGEIAVTLGAAQSAMATTDRHTSTLKTPFRPIARDAAAANGDTGMAQESAAGKVAPAESDEASLDAVQVGLRFELGRRSLSVGELKGIGAGHVFDLGLDPQAPVELIANGARIGSGEIVEIGERIGIRVVRLFGQD